MLDVIEDADGRELADFSTWVEFRLRRRREELDRPPDRGPPFNGPRGGGRPSPPPSPASPAALSAFTSNP
ncbi:hypothetical protein ACFQWF_16525 [Methylorubrum suomiense]